jgi:excisionase family DNA binding protein
MLYRVQMEPLMSGTAPLAHSVPNAASRIGISRSGLYVLIARGEIPIAKIGNRTLILDDDLRIYRARHRVEHAAGVQ